MARGRIEETKTVRVIYVQGLGGVGVGYYSLRHSNKVCKLTTPTPTININRLEFQALNSGSSFTSGWG
jgi:hypothetical protein